MRKIKTNIKNPELVAKRRNQILEAASELFRSKGYHATTMRKICQKAKVNQGSFYDYFGSKEDVLVSIYKQMTDRKPDWPSSENKITNLKEIENFLRMMMSNAWIRDKNDILLLYRETTSLDKQTRKEVLQLESDFVNWVAETLRAGLSLDSAGPELEIVANLVVFINAFIPMRAWNLRHIKQEEILNFTVDMLMKKLSELAPEGSEVATGKHHVSPRQGVM